MIDPIPLAVPLRIATRGIPVPVVPVAVPTAGGLADLVASVPTAIVPVSVALSGVAVTELALELADVSFGPLAEARFIDALSICQLWANLLAASLGSVPHAEGALVQAGRLVHEQRAVVLAAIVGVLSVVHAEGITIADGLLDRLSCSLPPKQMLVADIVANLASAVPGAVGAVVASVDFGSVVLEHATLLAVLRTNVSVDIDDAFLVDGPLAHSVG